MSRIINAKILALPLSKIFFYVIIPISLMGMINPGNPPGDDPYPDMYNRFTEDYNDTNQSTNILLGIYNDRLLRAIQSIANGAEQARLFADHHNELSQIDLNKALLISERIVSNVGYIDGFASHAKARIRNDQPQLNDQAILDSLNLANDIKQRAQDAARRAQDFANRAQASMQRADDMYNEILRIMNGMNQPILVINYTMDDVQHYYDYRGNNGMSRALSCFNKSNRFACTTREHAAQVHNQVIELDQLMQHVRQEGNNIGIELH